MHWINRGPEPKNLANIRARYTPGWIRRYHNGSGPTPYDAKWLDFKNELKTIFNDLCAYCEEMTKVEVDHFRPKSEFPQLVYEWDNWLTSCHPCNHSKSNKWPEFGFVDPCAVSTTERPELCFIFDAETGYMKANPELNIGQYRIAENMINDLGLNEDHHLKMRTYCIHIFKEGMPRDPSKVTERHRRTIRKFAARSSHCSSVIRAWLEMNGFGAVADW